MARITASPDEVSDISNAADIITETMKKHPEIDIQIWTSAFLMSTILVLKSLGFTKDEFIEEMDNIGRSYSKWFE